MNSSLTFTLSGLARREVLLLLQSAGSIHIAVSKISDTELCFAPVRNTPTGRRNFLRDMEELQNKFNLQIPGLQAVADFALRRRISQNDETALPASQSEFEAAFLAAL